MIDMPASAALRRIHRVALGDLVHRSALKFPERTAIVDGATRRAATMPEAVRAQLLAL